MRSLAKSAAAAAFRYSGMPRLIRRLTRDRVTIILYHDPTPEIVEAHLCYLSQRYTFITLDQVTDALHASDWSGIPAGAMVVTIDDGHRGNLALLEVFRRYGVVPTIYLVSEVVGTDRRFWFKAGAMDADALKALPHAERLHWMETRLGWNPERAFEGPPQALTLNDIEAMKPYVDFQVHTLTHPILTTCTAEHARREISGSKARLEALLDQGERVHFSYPNGDYTDREVAMVRDAGFRSARTIDVGWTGPGADPYRLKMTGVADDASLNWMITQITGLPTFLKYARATGRWDGRCPVVPGGQVEG